ncbi:transglutaminase family protein [Rhizobium sp. LjRoot30]|uniref:transglutaminase family protein n=1 Tax=Rhizobium sp. LjRoot30 TaxID=3342320 RepID=UPI003ECC6E10
MKLKITHTTEYAYEGPVQYSLQRLRLTPTASPGQKINSWSVSVEGAAVEVDYDDQFGNHIELVSNEGEQQSTRIVASGEVETEDRNGVFGPHVGFCPLWLFLRETPLTKPGKLVKELTRGVEAADPLARLHALMAAIHEAVAYEKGTTTAATTAEAAMEAKTGVCQDHAHIFIAAARLLDVPARYISGYLLLEGTVDQAAMHAWAEAHVPGLGWVGFDAANKICPDDRYVRIATGLDYTDAAPVSGMRFGSPEETLSVAIAVEDLGQTQSQSQSQ